MNGTSGFEEVQSSTPDHQPIGSCTSNNINSEQIPGITYASQLTKQASMHATRRIVLLCLSIAILFSGCSSFSSTLGYRPEFSTTSTPPSTPACELALLATNANAAKAACEEYYTAVKWGENVAQAYKTKAFMNEWSVYVAGAVGIIGLAVGGSLAATDEGNTDAAKIIPLVTAAVASLFALNQSDDKATAYGESVIAIEESLAAADRYVSHAKNKTIAGFQLGSDTLKDSVRQEIVNLDSRMVAIRKKTPTSIPTTTALFPESFKTAAQQHSFIIGTTNLETDPEGIRAIIVPDTDVTIKVEKVENGHVFLTLTNLKCQDYLVMLSVRNKLVLPARNLRCEK